MTNIQRSDDDVAVSIPSICPLVVCHHAIITLLRRRRIDSVLLKIARCARRGEIKVLEILRRMSKKGSLSAVSTT